MVTYLDEILDPTLLGQMMDEGYVQVRYHPDYPYAIYCYTKQAMFDRKWNDVTKICRGLIVNEETSEVLARPFKKFFNYGEPSAPFFAPSDLVEVTDKMDGSLGILYWTPDGPQIATKGSFTSEQATWATEHLRAQYGDTEWVGYEGITYCFEIIYPENRIVLDYGKTEGLFLLATIDIRTGQDVPLDIYDDPFAYQDYLMTGPFAGMVDHLNKAGFMNRKNKEGVVLRRIRDDERLKLKQEDYIELHKVLTGLNERQLWEWLSQGKSIVEILSDLPEEIHDWARPILVHLVDQFLYIDREIHLAFKESQHYDRKEFALFNQGKDSMTRGALFAKYDGDEKRLAEIIWKAIKP